MYRFVSLLGLVVMIGLAWLMSSHKRKLNLRIIVGGLGGMAPDRRGDLAKLALRAMLGGTLATYMTACVAGLLL